jgi:NAD(P)-dependent dehydrogenase (short-subunit alcohol dehydrogenase family)
MIEERKKLLGRVAIVTGGGRGLGKAIAEAMVRNGASVVINGRDSGAISETADWLKTLAGANQTVSGVVADVSMEKDCLELVKQAQAITGGVDILINNAGILGPMGPIEEVDLDEFATTIQVNLFGTVRMCRHVIPIMRKKGGGKIVNLSGGGGAVPLPFSDAYAVSKAAVVRLTENLAMELRDANIQVNAIAPGALNTKMLADALNAGPEKVGKEYYKRLERQRDEGGASLNKAADLAVFLASSDSDGITGKLISAVWDNWAQLPKYAEKLRASDIFTIRRIVPADRGESW